MTEDESVGWHHWLDGQGFERALGGDEGQGNLDCFSPQGCKISDTTEWLNNSVNEREDGKKYKMLEMDHLWTMEGNIYFPT